MLNKCYHCRFHTDKCKNEWSKNYNKFPEEINKCNFTFNICEKQYQGVSKTINKARKDYKCDFCGGYIFEGDSYISTIDFIEHEVLKSCNECHKTIFSIYGD